MIELFRLLKPARTQWRWMLGGIAMGVVVICANSLLMAISGWFIASMAVAGATKVSFNYFAPSAAIRALAITRTIGRYIERLVTHGAALRIVTSLRVWLYSKLEPLSPAILERYSSGDLAGRLRSDIDSMENIYLRIIAPLCIGTLSIFLSVLFVSLWCPQAAAALLVCLIFPGVIFPLLARRLAQGPGRKSALLSGELRSLASDGINGGAELLLLGAVDHQIALVERVSDDLVKRQRNLAELNGITTAGSVAFAGLGLMTVLLTGSVASIDLEISGPQLVMLLLFSAAAFESAGGMSAALQLLSSTHQSAMRITELSGSTLPVEEPAAPTAPPSDFKIVMHQVSFSYEQGREVLSNFNLEIPMGGRVAITGPSGEGKSSIIQLLLRFREYSGSITIGGIELKSLSADDLRLLISASPQNPHLFNSTIRDNILLAQPDSTESRINDALHISTLDDWIDQLPDGLETRVGTHGSAVSGGQMRRIAIARAILKHSPIIILDEPTEGLDESTEKRFLTRLDQHLKESGRSLLVISHREPCLAIVDKIIRMK